MSSYGIEVLERDECLRLLRTQAVGRVGIELDDRPAILPVVFGMLDDDVVFRTDPGSKLVAAVLERRVVFEADATDAEGHVGWDVNVVGHATEIVEPETIERADALGIRPWAGGVRDRWVRIAAEEVTGRRVTPHDV